MTTIPEQLVAPHLIALEGADVKRGAVVSTVGLSDATVITTISTYNGDIATSTE